MSAGNYPEWVLTDAQPWGARAERIRAMAARPDGVTTAEVAHVFGWDVGRASSTLCIMTWAKKEPLHTGSVAGSKNRWFARKDLAEQWMLLTKKQPSPVERQRRLRCEAREAEKAARLAEYNQRQAVSMARTQAPRLKVAKPSAQKMHTLGHLVPGARNARGLTIKEQTGPLHEKMAAPFPARGGVDYSRAVFTVCPSGRDTRFEVSGPVHSVVDARDCRAWAKAATA